MSSLSPKLEAIYAKLPRLVCQGRCQQSCGPVPVHQSELKQIRTYAKKRVRAEGDFGPMAAENFKVLKTDNNLTCRLLRKGDCTVYPVRPLICRLYGIAEGMECAWGCKPIGRYLTRDEVRALYDELANLR